MPDSDDRWVEFACRVRAERATLPGYSKMKVLVGGELHHRTMMTRGTILQRRIHTFDDAGDEFARIVAGSRHPVALGLPCECGSGRTFGDCCGAGVDEVVTSA